MGGERLPLISGNLRNLPGEKLNAREVHALQRNRTIQDTVFRIVGPHSLQCNSAAVCGITIPAPVGTGIIGAYIHSAETAAIQPCWSELDR